MVYGNQLLVCFNVNVAATQNRIVCLTPEIKYFCPFFYRTDIKCWMANVQDIVWLRNHIVAPFSEEFTFRACMMPLLLQSFHPITAVLLTPLFFGVAHLHHMIERLRSGMELKTALIVSGTRTILQTCSIPY